MESSSPPDNAAKPRRRARTTARKAPTKRKTADAARAFELPAHCTIHEVAQLKKRLAELAREPADLRIGSSELERIDTAGVQLLAVFAAQAQRNERRVDFVDASPVLGRAAELLGVSALLGLPCAAGTQ